MAVTLILETGAGIAGANAYADTTEASAYWDNQPHRALAVTWGAATSENQKGALIETSFYLDSAFGPYYRGVRKGYIQGLLWPRVMATGPGGQLLPSRPPELLIATYELAARALSAVLSADQELDAKVISKSVGVGPLSQSFTYATAASLEKKYGMVSGILTPLLNGLQPNAPVTGRWSWA